MCVLIFYRNFIKTFLILRSTERDLIKNVYWSSCKVTVILVRVCWSLNFVDRFSISDLMKIYPVGADLLHAGRTYGQTDMTKLTVGFYNFSNTPKKDKACVYWRIACTWQHVSRKQEVIAERENEVLKGANLLRLVTDNAGTIMHSRIQEWDMGQNKSLPLYNFSFFMMELLWFNARCSRDFKL